MILTTFYKMKSFIVSHRLVAEDILEARQKKEQYLHYEVLYIMLIQPQKRNTNNTINCKFLTNDDKNSGHQ